MAEFCYNFVSILFQFCFYFVLILFDQNKTKIIFFNQNKTKSQKINIQFLNTKCCSICCSLRVPFHLFLSFSLSLSEMTIQSFSIPFKCWTKLIQVLENMWDIKGNDIIQFTVLCVIPNFKVSLNCYSWASAEDGNIGSSINDVTVGGGRESRIL